MNGVVKLSHVLVYDYWRIRNIKKKKHNTALWKFYCKFFCGPMTKSSLYSSRPFLRKISVFSLICIECHFTSASQTARRTVHCVSWAHFFPCQCFGYNIIYCPLGELRRCFRQPDLSAEPFKCRIIDLRLKGAERREFSWSEFKVPSLSVSDKRAAS